MGKTTKAVAVASRAVDTLLDIDEGETVLVIADDAGMIENGEIVEAVVGRSRDEGAETNLIVIDDVPRGVETVPDMAEEAMRSTDVLIGITKTTAASVIHNTVPTRLMEQGELRRLYMVKRSFDALTSPNVLEADYQSMITLAEDVLDVVEEKSDIRITSAVGTDLTASIDDVYWKNNRFAHEAGTYTGISWGEVNTGPIVGTMQGTAVFDGPILEYGWPSPPLEMEIDDGRVAGLSGDSRMASKLRTLIDAHDNADNIAEIGFGLNRNADLEETNIWKKGRGRVHLAIGNGTSYGQSVDSPVHVDMVMNEPTVEVDGHVIVDEGEFVV